MRSYMVATVGRKQLTFKERKQLYRKTPRTVRKYGYGFLSEHSDLINSFTADDYQAYETLLHTWGTPGRKKEVMLTKCVEQSITGPQLELAKIRVYDLSLHQRIVGALRHRWTNNFEIKKEKLNNNPEIFWKQMASAIQRRSLDPKYQICKEWLGVDGKIKLIEFLKTQYSKQNGMCAISKEQMVLESGTGTRNPSKCSPDRKNSNKGYTPDNIWLVTSWVNIMKLDTPLITFWRRIDQLTKARQYNLTYCKNKPRYKIG